MTISKQPKLHRSGHPDNFQTPASALDCLVPYLPLNIERKTTVIWEPACGKGNLVVGLREQGFYVVHTDIIDGPYSQGGFDFFGHINCAIVRKGKINQNGFDVIVTNPPFSKKQQFLARCYQLGKPFALLMPITTFDSRECRTLFHKHGIQIIMPDGRINFETPNGKGSSAWFYTAWFCWGFNLPQQIMYAGMQQRELI